MLSQPFGRVPGAQFPPALQWQGSGGWRYAPSDLAEQ